MKIKYELNTKKQDKNYIDIKYEKYSEQLREKKQNTFFFAYHKHMNFQNYPLL